MIQDTGDIYRNTFQKAVQEANLYAQKLGYGGIKVQTHCEQDVRAKRIIYLYRRNLGWKEIGATYLYSKSLESLVNESATKLDVQAIFINMLEELKLYIDNPTYNIYKLI